MRLLQENIELIPAKSVKICWKSGNQTLPAFSILSPDTNLLIVELEREIVKCMLIFHLKIKLFQIAASQFARINGPP